MASCFIHRAGGFLSPVCHREIGGGGGGREEERRGGGDSGVIRVMKTLKRNLGN